jgi:teichuronic acid biosynthesis glycosyltransferase TuaG
MQQSLVSIVMPMYNAEKYLEQAVKSVLAQTYPHWELLIINDHSTDHSVEIARKFETADSRIHLYNTDYHNGMPSAPRNTGVRLAQGRFIAFLDSDDLWAPEKLSQQVSLFKDDNVFVVYSDYEKIEEDGARKNRIVRAPLTLNYKKLLRGNAIGNLTGIYDTQKVGKIAIKNIHHEDYAMWLEILKKGGIALNTNTVTAFYRLSNSGVSRKKSRLLTWQWNIYRQVEHLSIAKSMKLYCCYAYFGLKKFLT